jgi:Cu(I)/Ag(I) efflux system membrane protein CusA/SilA
MWQDARIREVPEVDGVFGKTGRAETALDPAPLSMFETVVRLKPREQWRPGMTIEKITAELDEKTKVPGVQSAWTMPIKARIDMLSTGIRTPIGVKVFGAKLEEIVAINDQLERSLRDVPGTRSVYAERELGGFFLDVVPDRAEIARYGLTVREVLDVVESSIGGMDVDTTIEGRERYRVNVRYPRELRDDPAQLRNILVPIPRMRPGALPSGGGGAPAGAMSSPSVGGRPSGGAVMGGGAMGGGLTPNAVANIAGGGGGGMGGAGMSPAGGAMPGGGAAGVTSMPVPDTTSGTFVTLGQLARIETVMGPPMIKSEMGQLTGWVYVDVDTSDIGGWVDRAKVKVAREVKMPPGYVLKWTGQYELLERVRDRLAFILPLTIAIVFGILYLNFKGAAQALIVMTSVPFAAVGAIWALWIAPFNTSIAVWVGMIALLGVAAETASVMVVYLEDAWNDGRASGAIKTTDDLIARSVEAGSLRVRPLLMTVLSNVFGLLPIMFDTGVGADVAKRIAAPMWGGLVSLTLLTLLVIPAVWVVWRSFHLGRERRRAATPAPAT